MQLPRNRIRRGYRASCYFSSLFFSLLFSAWQSVAIILFSVGGSGAQLKDLFLSD
eukprot:m.393902 g.393902  ORF g.393902 m.393902 type:complete len:55 (-) comp56365_c0_seq1:916-1080(-)